MKKLFFNIAILSLFATAGFGQVLKPVKIDSLVTVSLPKTYAKKDTLGQQIFYANSTYGYLVVMRAPNAKGTAPLKKENDLNSVLKSYVEGIQDEAGNSTVMNTRDTTIGNLKAKLFTLRTDDGKSEIQLRNIAFIYTQDATYTFAYVYPENRVEVAKADVGAYFNSIKLSPELQRTDQYLSSSPAGMSPVLRITLFGLGGIILILVIVYVTRRRRLEY